MSPRVIAFAGVGALLAASACADDFWLEPVDASSADAGSDGAQPPGDAGAEMAAPDGGDDPVPVVPVGLDAYRQWDRLPVLRFGVRALMRSTYDRSGGNEAADASHFLRQDADDQNVSLDLAGPGVLYFVRTNHWHGSPWHYRVDGSDHVVSESSTADPLHPVADSTFQPEAAFPNPLTWTWSQTKGADLSWVPIAHRTSLSLAYGRTHYGTGYYIAHRFAEGAANLSQALTTWNEEPPTQDVLALLSSAGSDIAPAGAGVSVTGNSVSVKPGETALLAELTEAPSMLRALRVTLKRSQAVAGARARLRVTWDGRSEPSIDAPLGLLFGTGSLYNRNDVEWLVKALLANVRFSSTDVVLSMYFPMPFFERARFELVAGDTTLDDVRFEARTVAYAGARHDVAYFHATYRDHASPVPGKDLVLLDTTSEGGGDWCGHFVGTSFVFSDQAVLSTLEGDPRFFFDDSQTPQAQGTGTEEWAGGGDYWGGQNMTLPLAGHPVGAPSPALVQDPEDAVESAYRFLLADLMPFGKNARIQLEHGGLDDSVEHYRSVSYWYGAPGACLVQTDSLHVGDASDEAAHDYLSPDASPPETLSSRYEWGPDHLNGVEIFPESSDTGRHTSGTSELTLAIRPDNHGVLLRRKLDYAIPNQMAEVSIADATPAAPFVPAGTWYLAGSNSDVYSNPPDELGPPEHVVQTSNRRWRDDEFLLPSELTRGRSAIRIRLRHVPRDLPLVPGGPITKSAWSEFRYSAYSYVWPQG